MPITNLTTSVFFFFFIQQSLSQKNPKTNKHELTIVSVMAPSINWDLTILRAPILSGRQAIIVGFLYMSLY